MVKPGATVEDSLNGARGTVLEVHTDIEGEFRGMEVEWTSPRYDRKRYRTSDAGHNHAMGFFLIIHKRPTA